MPLSGAAISYFTTASGSDAVSATSQADAASSSLAAAPPVNSTSQPAFVPSSSAPSAASSSQAAPPPPPPSSYSQVAPAPSTSSSYTPVSSAAPPPPPPPPATSSASSSGNSGGLPGAIGATQSGGMCVPFASQFYCLSFCMLIIILFQWYLLLPERGCRCVRHRPRGHRHHRRVAPGPIRQWGELRQVAHHPGHRHRQHCDGDCCGYVPDMQQ